MLYKSLLGNLQKQEKVSVEEKHHLQMSKDKVQGNEVLYNYVIGSMNKIPSLQMRLREETWARFGGSMLSAPDQCEHMKFLIKATGAKQGIEVGVFTGYSALCMAQALPSDGKLIALDISEDFTSIGRKYWKEAGVDKKIDLRLGPAVEILDALCLDKNNLEDFDFAYIDADKQNYLNYYQRIMKLLKPNGFIMLDNVIWKG